MECSSIVRGLGVSHRRQSVAAGTLRHADAGNAFTN